MGLSFGVDYIVPLLPEFLRRYPKIHPDWRFESRQVDLIAEGLDVAIGGGIELSLGLYRARSRLCTSLPSPRRTI